MFVGGDIHAAAVELAKQRANVVLGYSHCLRRPVFRRGSIPLAVPQAVTDELYARTCQGERLFCLHERDCSAAQVESALEEMSANPSRLPEESFADRGIKVYREFPKALFVAPYGAVDGQKIRRVAPHLGIERISSYLLRHTTNTDSRVYNPNLGTPEELAGLLEREKFTLIGFSFLHTVLDHIAYTMALAKKASPESLIICGGPGIEKVPVEVLFRNLPVDVVVFGPGEEPVTQIVEACAANPLALHERKFPEMFGDIGNLMILAGAGEKRTFPQQISTPSVLFVEDIPYQEEPDCLHGKSYGANPSGDENLLLGYGQLGFWPLRLKLSDHCRGGCFFCHATRNTTQPQEPEVVAAVIENYPHPFDHIHLEDHDFLYDPAKAEAFCDLMIEKGFDRIPKRCSVRVSDVANSPGILPVMFRGGIQVVTFGIESFDQGILDFIGKGSTVEQNHFAIDKTIKAGITPGIFMIFFTPLETAETLEKTYQAVLPYLRKGAYLGLATGLKVQYGDPWFRRNPDLIEYERVFFEGMRRSLQLPRSLRVLDPQIRALKERHRQEKEAFADAFAKKHGIKTVSLSVASLIYFRFLYTLLGKPEAELSEVDELVLGMVRQEEENTRLWQQRYQRT